MSHQSDTQKIELLGTTAARVIYDAYQTIEWNDDPDIFIRSQRVDLTYEKFGYDENGEFSGTVLNLIPIDYVWGGWQCTGQAEDDERSAFHVNANGAQRIAEAAAAIEVPSKYW